jgi:prephenate dehydrogenase
MAANGLAHARVAIVGLGLMGGSLAMGLRGHCAALLGIDPDERTIELARQRMVVDLAATEPAALLPQADLVVLAAPVRAILGLLERLPGLHPGNPVVIDLGSTKQAIAAAMQALPERFDPLPAHPMCGKEQASLEYAEASLYRGAPFAFTPLVRTGERARRIGLEIAAVLEACPLWLDPATHDRWTAATSHAVYLVSNALACATPAETRSLIGPGFRSTARLAPSSPAMMLDILATNPENVLGALGRFRQALDALESALVAGDQERLRERLALGAANYADLTG